MVAHCLGGIIEAPVDEDAFYLAEQRKKGSVMYNRAPCPFIKAPFEECYVSSMNSSSIDRAVYYCAGNFKECEIYRRFTEPEETESDASKKGFNPFSV